LHTGNRQIDDFVVNPPPRIDFRGASTAVDSSTTSPEFFAPSVWR
jgi:hypothetical protein